MSMRTAVGIVGNILAFAIAWVLGSVVFRALAPFPRIPQVTDKLEQFASGKPCNVGFFGTSKIYGGLIPGAEGCLRPEAARLPACS